MRLGACELEIDLFCRGLRVPLTASLDEARGVRRTRAGLGSGLELVLPTGSRLKPEIWMNAPIAESFAKRSPYVLCTRRDGPVILDERHGYQYGVRIPREPAWYRQTTWRGTPMSRIGVLQGTYLGIYVNSVCDFWRSNLQCRFCTTGDNVGEAEAAGKTIGDVVETCRAAKRESGITFVHLNGGFQGGRALEVVEPFVRAIMEQVGLLVGVQLAPERVMSRYDRLIAAGVDHFSFCMELMDPAWFARVCPGKARSLGHELFFEAMTYCAARMPRGAVSGELIAGIEPIANTVACRRHLIPIGLAPNIEVSLVVNPDDAALAPRTAAFYCYEAWRRALRLAARPLFRWRLHPHRRDHAAPAPLASGMMKT